MELHSLCSLFVLEFVITRHACVHIVGVNVNLKGFTMVGDLESFNDVFFFSFILIVCQVLMKHFQVLNKVMDLPSLLPLVKHIFIYLILSRILSLMRTWSILWE